MASLKRTRDGKVVPLAAQTSIGRGPAAWLRLSAPLVSTEHGSIVWRGNRWELRDLGSRNGTRIGTQSVEAGKPRPLKQGDRITFGDAAEVWDVMDLAAPGPVAKAQSGDLWISGQAGMLVLPDESHPEVTIYQGTDGSWLAEKGSEEPQPVYDRDTIRTQEHTFLVSLPHAAEATPLVEATAGLGSVELLFRVSRDEERVEVSLLFGGRTLPLDAREHGYVLLTLARAREQDRHLPDAERGWIDREELLSMLGLEGNTLDVAVHRARRQFLDAGIEGAAGIVEVRRGARRLGTDRFRIEPL